MKIVLIVIGIIIAVIILIAIGIFLWLWITIEKSDNKEGPSKWEEHIMNHPLPQAKRYYGEEHEWNPKFNLHHRGVRVRNIPFVPDKKEVFYLENEYDEPANKFIQENISYIKELFAKKGFRFTYLPDKKLNFAKLEMFAKYLYPNYKINRDENIDEEADGIIFKNGIVSLKSSFLLDYMVNPGNRKNVKSSFAWLGSEKKNSDSEGSTYTFDYITFDATEANVHPKEILDEIFPEVGESKIFGGGAFMIVHDYEGEEEQRTRPYKGGSEDSHSSLGATEDDYKDSMGNRRSYGPPLYSARQGSFFGHMIAPEEETASDKRLARKSTGINLSKGNTALADEHFDDIDALDDETRNTLIDVQHKLESVRLSGISEAIIAKFIKPMPTISMMVVTHDFHIILSDYGNMEIMMEPLVKAVYILFLRHPEGIMFKDLYDYRKELEIIYRCVKAKNNQIDRLLESPASPQISKNVDSLCNPTKNSINEKCTRIKEAFIMKFSDYLAQNYYITGSKATVKKISLPRSYVYWEKDDTHNTETDMAKI